ncbi:fimbrial protein [Yersinia mollaretii]|uniref:fimbrial protein n=1 Tax=Yersinia mollaretii TaxID=33060 RepID=UPI0011A5D945|nr:type 1 fimbrial protein [Yersinia mollaretii]
MNINMKKKLIVTSLLAASVLASAANAATINVTGSIAASPCVTTTTNAAITMPLLTDAQLGKDVGKFSASATNLTIKLTGCPAISQTATVKFSGTADTEEKKAWKLDNVEGVALALFEDDGLKQIEVNTDAKAQDISNVTTKDLKYKLKYVKTSKTLKSGNAQAAIDYDITYN